MKLKALVAGLIAAAFLTTAAVAGAVPNPPEPNAAGSGWDDVNDLIVGSGSDTTYAFMQGFEKIYNQANGCDTNNSTGSATVGNCLTGAQQGQTDARGNWDHDYAVSKYPTGSGAGVKELQDGKVDYARSSSAPAAAGGGQGDVNFWAYGKDGIVVVTFGNRATGNLTTAQLASIWNCSVTDWGTLLGGAPNGQTIQPWGMNAASGTKRTFQGFLGLADINAGGCVKKLDNGIFPFENDVKQLNTDPSFDANNAIWWMSFAEFKAFAYKRQDAKTWDVNGTTVSNTTVSNGSYPFTRFIWHVTKKADATADAATENVLGASGGKGGAVRELTEFMCKASGSHSNNLFSGLTNYQEMSNVYTATGFIRLPTADRTNGICKFQAGVA